jgi:nucleoside-diphosphate-sugar epimerase
MYDLKTELNNKVICITGAGGYIGSALVDRLKKYSVKKIIRVSRKKLTHQENLDDWILDLNEFDSWLKIVEKSDIIFHLAGNTSVIFAEQSPKSSLIAELLPINNLVRASKQLQLNPRVIYTSTATIYGLTEEFPVSESFAPAPITCYDSNKLHAEKQLEIASKAHDISSVSLRLANVYGPSPNESSAFDRGILSKIVKMSFENKTISLYGSGKYTRDYIYIDDVVSALIDVSIISYSEILKNSKSVLNVSSERGTHIKTIFNLILEEVGKITGKNLKIKNVPWPNEVSEIEKRNFIGSAQRLKSLTGWTPETSIEEGIKLLVEYYSKEYL